MATSEAVCDFSAACKATIFIYRVIPRVEKPLSRTEARGLALAFDKLSDKVKAKTTSVSLLGRTMRQEKTSKAASRSERSAGIEMPEALIDSFAKEITGIYRNHDLTRTSPGDLPAFSLEQAYAVQERLSGGARIAGGERFIGYKVGCTSPGNSRPVRLVAANLRPSSGSASLSGRSNPLP